MTGNDGDLRSLWQAQPPSGKAVSLDAIRRLDAKLARQVRWRNAAEYLAAGIVAIASVNIAIVVPALLMKVAALALLVAVVFVVWKLRRDGTSRPPPRPDAPAIEHIAHHRAELARQRDLLRTVPRWYLAPLFAAITIFYLAALIAVLPKGPPGPILFDLAKRYVPTVALFGLIWWMNLRAAARLQRRIDALDD
jgi:hypothetical protein